MTLKQPLRNISATSICTYASCHITRPLPKRLRARPSSRHFPQSDSFREDCDIRVWLCQIAKNCYFTHVKKLQREQPLESSDADVPDSLLSGPMEAVLSKETVTEIQRSLHGLDEPYKEVFMWRTLGELSFKQIGALFGKTENWACVTYHRARKKIQEGMEGFNNEK